MENKPISQIVSNEQKIHYLIDSVVNSPQFTSLPLNDQNEFMAKLRSTVMERRINQRIFLVSQVTEIEQSLKTV